MLAYIKDIVTRPDGTAEVRIMSDGPGGRSTIWGPYEYGTEERAIVELNTRYQQILANIRQR